MAVLDDDDASFLGIILEAIFWGIYVVIFALYLNLPKRSSGSRLIYPLSALFILCTAFVAIDITQEFLSLLHSAAPNTEAVTDKITVVTSLIYACVDFISQGVLIYRCWIVWDRNLLVVIIPSILSLTSFATNLPLVGVEIILIQGGHAPAWFTPLGTASFSISLTVNIIVTGILILKLAMMHRELQKSLGPQGLKLGSLISLLIESGMLTFASQLIWVVLFNLQNTNNGFDAVDGVVTLACGIAPTAVIVRVAMGKSYENKVTNVVESTVSFAMRPNDHGTMVTTTSAHSKTSNGTRFDGTRFDGLEKGVY